MPSFRERLERPWGPVMDSLNVGVLWLDPHGDIVHANAALCRWFGLPDHYLDQRGRRLRDLVEAAPAAATVDPALWDALDAAVARGLTWQGLEVTIAPQGKPVGQFVLNAGPVSDRDGKPVGVVASLSEVTWIREAERRHRELAEWAPDAILEVDPEGRVVAANRAAARLYGCDRLELVGLELRRLLRDVEGPDGQGEAPHETVAARIDGGEVPVEVASSRRVAGAASHRTIALRDLSPAHRRHRQGAAAEQLARAVNEAGGAEEFCATLATGLRHALGYDRVRILGKDASDSLLRVWGAAGDVEDQPLSLQADRGALAVQAFLERRRVQREQASRLGAASVPDPWQEQRLQGTTWAVPILIGEEPAGVLECQAGQAWVSQEEEGQTLDTLAFQIGLALAQKLVLAELRATAQRLVASNRELDAFVYTASHDLAEPLRSMANFSQFLLDDFGDKLDPQAKDYALRIRDAARRMRSLLDALLQFSRIRHKPLPFEAIDTDALLRQVRESLDALVREKRAEVVVPPGLPQIIGQPTRILEVFTNLIGNGIKFNESTPPRVEVEAQESAGLIEFSVRDNGIGIPSESKDQVFKLFTRLHPRERYPGTGAGLAIVRAIVEQHGGRIALESRVGKGTIVRFTLPKGSP